MTQVTIYRTDYDWRLKAKTGLTLIYLYMTINFRRIEDFNVVMANPTYEGYF